MVVMHIPAKPRVIREHDNRHVNVHICGSNLGVAAVAVLVSALCVLVPWLSLSDDERGRDSNCADEIRRRCRLFSLPWPTGLGDSLADSGNDKRCAAPCRREDVEEDRLRRRVFGHNIVDMD